MTTNSDRASAKIFQFPARGRFATGGQSGEAKLPANPIPTRAIKVAAGGAWYHDEAIRESESASNS